MPEEVWSSTIAKKWVEKFGFHLPQLAAEPRFNAELAEKYFSQEGTAKSQQSELKKVLSKITTIRKSIDEQYSTQENNQTAFEKQHSKAELEKESKSSSAVLEDQISGLDPVWCIRTIDEVLALYKIDNRYVALTQYETLDAYQGASEHFGSPQLAMFAQMFQFTRKVLVDT